MSDKKRSILVFCLKSHLYFVALSLIALVGLSILSQDINRTGMSIIVALAYGVVVYIASRRVGAGKLGGSTKFLVVIVALANLVGCIRMGLSIFEKTQASRPLTSYVSTASVLWFTGITVLVCMHELRKKDQQGTLVEESKEEVS